MYRRRAVQDTTLIPSLTTAATAMRKIRMAIQIQQKIRIIPAVHPGQIHPNRTSRQIRPHRTTPRPLRLRDNSRRLSAGGTQQSVPPAFLFEYCGPKKAAARPESLPACPQPFQILSLFSSPAPENIRQMHSYQKLSRLMPHQSSSTSLAAPQIPASFPSVASANFTFLFAKNARSINGSLM